MAVPCLGSEFWIYKDRASRENHYIPSGWMGDTESLKVTKLIDSMRIEYSTYPVKERWVGIYWQHPANNFGNKKGGYNLTGYKILKFKVRGEKGNEFIDQFFIGGIPASIMEGDSDNAYIERIVLTKEWQEFSIDLSKLDLSHIIGGFGFSANIDVNPNGIIFYLKEIRLEK